MICKPCGKEYTKDHKKQSMCKDCTREYNRKYHSNRSKESLERKQQLQVDRREKICIKIYEYLSKHCCEMCGIDDPVVLEFDHIDQDTKTFTIADAKGKSWARIIEEIKKCRVLCCNCHRRHTAKQLGWYSYIKLTRASGVTR